jgi:alpha-beta hydrolase superfamily lysophospholipase
MTVHHRRSAPSSASSSSEELRRANEAHRRAMPLQRLLDNGMKLADAERLLTLSLEDIPWHQAGESLGEENLRLDREAAGADRLVSAHDYFLHACACFRFAQSAFPRDTPEKLQLYEKVVRSFTNAMALESPTPLKVEVPFRGGSICGWLLSPMRMERPAAVVVFGGADGWRESYYPIAKQLLARSLAVCLLDLPGQGETRLKHGLYLDSACYAGALSDVISALRWHLDFGDRLGVLGNSLGGTLAAGIACKVPDVAAVCVNGGSSRPTEVIECYPRMIERIGAMLGNFSEDAVRTALAALSLGSNLEELRCPLLVLHGARDRVFHLSGAREIYERAASEEKEMVIWEDGDHCIYNHSDDRNAVLGDWFSDKIG